MGRLAPLLIVVGAALAYPLAVLAFAGAPHFPSRDDCVVEVTGEGEYEVVFGYRDSQYEARALQDEVVAVGFGGIDTEHDGCGRVRVSLDDLPSREVAEDLVQRARELGFEATLEQEA